MKKKFKNLIEEFKKFITKGNVLDLAVAVIIGAAFSKIVTSLVNDMVMPLVTAAIGGQSLADLSWVLKPELLAPDGEMLQAALTIKWGSFLQNIIDFLIIAVIVFSFVKILATVKSASEKLHAEAKELIKEYGLNKSIPESVEDKLELALEPKVQDIKEENPVVANAQLGKIETLLEDIRQLLKEKKD